MLVCHSLCKKNYLVYIWCKCDIVAGDMRLKKITVMKFQLHNTVSEVLLTTCNGEV